MDSRPTTAESKHNYQSTHWNRAPSNSSAPGLPSAGLPETPGAHVPAHVDLLPILFPQQSSIYQAQLLNYNKLISPGRGGGGGLQTPPLRPVLSTPHIQAAPRSRSSSKTSNKDSSHSARQSGTQQNCHGSRGNKNADKTDRAVTAMGKETPARMSAKQGGDQSQAQSQTQNHSHSHSHHPPSSRSAQRSSKSPHPPAPAQASSVPSTPHQHARNYSFESREPSPNATQNHSPRSAYSETNSTLPSLRPLPPRFGGCIYETALVRSRRRMPYSLGVDRLESVDLGKIKSKLSEDEGRKLTADMRELYDRLKPTEKVKENREKFVAKLEKILNEEWPGHKIGVHMFGSSGNKLCTDDSDVDICITTDWKELENVCMIAELLAKRGMEKVVCVSSARVPIVKIWDPELSLACDMNVNNTLALENTRMVLTYVEIDEPRVRPLAMVIKHWTRRRIINDAAFGGTLSSYTWICMIIMFLQMRSPPVLPALHQMPQHKLPETNGRKSAFADDLDKLRGFGDKNKESLGELLFQFFRFYAYEFDYDKLVLSVRLGKTILKTEKNWQTALNNMLCVEEPFNTQRNLGNTADDTSFRGLHMELRRAFELISEAKLDECCEQYVFPKEEEKVFQKPPPRPILLRSSSQQHSGRGGRGGNYRGNRQFHRNGNNNRRASSSVGYDNNNAMYIQQQQQQQQQHAVAHQQQAAQQSAQKQGQLQPQQSQQPQQPQQNMTPQHVAPQDIPWYPPQFPFHPDMLGSALSALQIQEHSLRFQLYTQSQHFAQQQALAHAQRMQGSPGQSGQSGDRSRTNSFDNPPLTAPLRPDLYMYTMPLPTTPFFMPPNGFTTLPSSPAAGAGVPEFRRSLHRAGANAESPSSTGAVRSQSQPAARTPMPGSQHQSGYASPGQANGSIPTFAQRPAIPSFIPDENADSEVDEASQGKTISDCPSEEEGSRYLGYYVNESPSPSKSVSTVSSIPNGIPSFGDMGQGGNNGGAANGGSNGSQARRRLSTDQHPQTILDRRMRRASRSPSPLGHARAFSVGTNTAPLQSVPFVQNGVKSVKEPRPLVVNGSSPFKPSSMTPALSSRHPSASESVVSAESSYDNPLRISHGLGITAAAPPVQPLEPMPSYPDRPLVVDGSSIASTLAPVPAPAPSLVPAPMPMPMPAPLADAQSFGQRVAAMSGFTPMPYAAVASNIASSSSMNGGAMQWSPSTRQRIMSRQQQKGIAPLDLALPEHTLLPELQHLSPVYEHRTPSPTAVRKFSEAPFGQAPMSQERFASGSFASGRKDMSAKSYHQKTSPDMTSSKHEFMSSPIGNPRVSSMAARESGHVRSAKSESGENGGWQKPKSRKKTADLKTTANGHPHSEQLPKNEADRKGG